MTTWAISSGTESANLPSTPYVRERDDHTAWYVEQGLRCYVEAVAAAIGLPADGVGSELADTATGYIALTARSPAFPDHDLMLTWTDTDGWVLATEPAAPRQPPEALACLTGDVLPAPSLVACFLQRALTISRHDSAPGPVPWASRELAANKATSTASGHHIPLHATRRHHNDKGQTP